MSMLGPGIPSLALQKATLVVKKGSPRERKLKFKYNPEKFTYTKSALWSEGERNRHEDPPSPTYQKTSPATVTMEVFFDAFNDGFWGDVTKSVKTLIDWTKPCPQPNGVPNPPLLAIEWGSSPALRGFRGYLSNVTANYTMFRMNGTPIRAECSITLTEVPNPSAKQNPTSGTEAGMHAHVIVAGETLHSVAWAEYGRADYWRALADFNDIDDPLRIEPGTRLLLPSRRDAARLV